MVGKRIFKVIICIVLLIIAAELVVTNSSPKQTFVSKLKGKIVYLYRDGELLNLYTSNANLQNKKLIYSHKGYGEENENIIDFYYNEDEETYYFVAMKDGEWGLFSIKENEELNYIKMISPEKFNRDDRYLSTKLNGVESISKNGSIYLIKDGVETKLKKFYGIYDVKFNPGYEPIGFSPNGRYLIYDYFGNLTPVGTIAREIIEDLFKIKSSESKVYIMDLETNEINEYINIYGNALQWLD